VFHAGEILVVDYNSVLCPLAVVGEGGVSYDEVVAELDTIRDPSLYGTVEPDDALLAAERAIAAAIFATPTLDAAWTAQGGDARESVAAGFEAITGLAWRAPDEPTLAAALALTPSLRFNELYGARQITPRGKMPPHLPGMWLAWLGFAAAGERLAQRRLGMQELTTIWMEQLVVMYAIARWNDAPALSQLRFGNVRDPLVSALAQRCVANRKPRPLGEVVAEVFREAGPAARVAALKASESVLKAAFS
jgi:hypothetical protein